MRFVATGLFRFVRDPMYLGALMILAGDMLYFSSFWILAYTVVLWLALQTFTVFYEEPQLKRRFGDEYESYLSEVPR